MDTRTQEFLEYVQSGGQVETTDWMPDEYRAKLVKFIEMHGNSELMGVLPERDWILRAPTLQRKLALTAKIQDEVGHAQLIYRVVEDLGKPRTACLDDLVSGKAKFHNVFHYPTKTWGDVGVIAWLVDAAAIVSQKALLKCSYAPYARIMKKICWEESFHILHGRDVILAMVTGTDEQFELVQEALDRWWEPLMHFHGNPIPAEEDPMYVWRIKSQANEDARQEFLDGYVPQIRELGLVDSGRGAREGRGDRRLELHRARLGEAPRGRHRPRAGLAGAARLPPALARGRRLGRAGGARRSGVSRRDTARADPQPRPAGRPRPRRRLADGVADDAARAARGSCLRPRGRPAGWRSCSRSSPRSMAVFGFLGGNVAARLGPRRTMLVADACRAPLVALIPLLHALDALSFPLILAVAAATAAFVTHSFAAKTSLVPELVGEDERVLSEANALLQGAQRITIFLGPALAGVLIAAIGAANVLLLDAVSFAIGFLLVLTFVPRVGRIEQDDESRGLAAGFRFLARDRLLRPWTIAVVLGDVGWLVLFAAMPVLVIERFGEDPALARVDLGRVGARRRARERHLVPHRRGLRPIAHRERRRDRDGRADLAPPHRHPGRRDHRHHGRVGTCKRDREPARARDLHAPDAARAARQGVVRRRSPRPRSSRRSRSLAAGVVLETDGFRPVILALVAVQTLAAIAFTAAGLRERARIGQVVTA